MKTCVPVNPLSIQGVFPNRRKNQVLWIHKDLEKYKNDTTSKNKCKYHMKGQIQIRYERTNTNTIWRGKYRLQQGIWWVWLAGAVTGSLKVNTKHWYRWLNIKTHQFSIISVVMIIIPVMCWVGMGGLLSIPQIAQPTIHPKDAASDPKFVKSSTRPPVQKTKVHLLAVWRFGLKDRRRQKGGDSLGGPLQNKTHIFGVLCFCFCLFCSPVFFAPKELLKLPQLLAQCQLLESLQLSIGTGGLLKEYVICTTR